jgi:hypothetical protein
MPTYHPPLRETDRLLLTWPTPEQIDGYYDSIIGTNIFDTIFWDGPSDAQELRDWWEQIVSRSPLDFSLSLATAVIERASGRYIGGVSLRPSRKGPRCSRHWLRPRR